MALLASIIGVALLYALSQLATMSALRDLSTTRTPIADAAAALIGPAGAIVVSIGSLVSIAGTNSGSLLDGSRMLYALALDRPRLRPIRTLHPRFGTPARAIAIQAVLASVLVAFGSFDSIVAYFVFITVVFISMTVAAVLWLGSRDLALRPPGHPLPAIGFLAMVAGLLLLLALNNPLQAVLGVAIVCAGIPAYHLIAKRDPRRVTPAGRVHQRRRRAVGVSQRARSTGAGYPGGRAHSVTPKTHVPMMTAPRSRRWRVAC